jgi:Tat protein translocase TatB subunit
MFGIGYQEMFVVLVVALVVFGPSRLPELAGQLGRWVRDFRRMSSELTGEFEKTIAEVEEVKKSFKREFEGIQDEVEGVGKSVRGDLKKGTKSPVAAKRASSTPLKSGTASTAAASKSATAASGANGSRGKMPALQQRARDGEAANANGLPNNGLAPLATKSDPLVDVSFFDLDVELIVSKNGKAPTSNGDAAAAEDAISRVRRRRAEAAYSRRVSA